MVGTHFITIILKTMLFNIYKPRCCYKHVFEKLVKLPQLT